jgi:cell volume regulation protein A
MQGTSIGWVAAHLELAGTSAPHADPLELVSNGERDIEEISIGIASPGSGKRIVDLDLPPNTLILLVDRAGTHIIPRGGTTLQHGDHVLVLTPKDQLPAVQKAVAG